LLEVVKLLVTISSAGPLNSGFIGELHASIEILKPFYKKSMAATPKSSTSPKLVHKLQSPCSQKKKEQKENEESPPLVDKPAPL
jgi:hypothetical protein